MSKNRKKPIIIFTVIAFLIFLADVTCTVIYERRVAKDCEINFVGASAERTEDLKIFIDNKMNFLNLLAQFLDGDKDISQGELKELEVIRESLSADSVGFYDLETSYCVDNTGDKYLLPSESIAKAVSVGKKQVVNISTGGKYLNRLLLLYPMYEGDKVTGAVFAILPSDEFAEKFSGRVYENEGGTILVNYDGSIVIPDSFPDSYDPELAEIIQAPASRKKIAEYVGKMLAGKGNAANVFVDNERFYAYGEVLEGYNELCVISVADYGTIFRATSKNPGVIFALFAILAILITLQVLFYTVGKRNVQTSLEDTVNYDELTGLPLKSVHKEQVTKLLAKAKCKYAYAIADVSGFKFINSTMGYEYGNTVLKHISQVVVNSLTREESASRTSGDHFAMLLKYETVDGLVKRLETLLDRACDVPDDGKGKRAKIVFTCGVYLIEGNEDVNRIRSHANVARKGIRKSVTNEIAFYSDEDFEKDIEAHELEADLVNAIKNKELVVYLQPKYGIPDEEVMGAEALIRWNHPTKGLISPNQFIPLAEANGFVKDIDFYVFETICKKLSDWEKQGKKLITISVNFSRLHLSDEDFVGKLTQLARKYNVEPKYLEIELTETAVYDEMDKLLDVMYLIKEAGFGLSMDDFGSGYSSLHLLREMPVDVLKLDKGFLEDCGNMDNNREQKVISHIISMAKDLEITVLAEGVETEEQKSFLQNARCDIIQGYYYAKPMRTEEFDRYMKDA